MAFILPISKLSGGLKRSSSTTGKNVSSRAEILVSRRAYLHHLGGVACAFLITEYIERLLRECVVAEAATPPSKETIINSVLSAYGLPTIADKRGFTLLTQQYGRLVVQFQYPSAWVVTRNVAPSSDPAELPIAGDASNISFSKAPLEGRASGLTASDYRRAEGVAFFVTALPTSMGAVSNVPIRLITSLVTPGDATGVTSDVRVIEDSIDADGFRIIDTLYESTTISGYSIERKARTKATLLSDGKLYALNASCSAVRWKKMVENINACLNSFRVFIL